MTAIELFRDGKLNEAIQALNEQVRANPSDTKTRTFLFELLCFAGEFDRAEKQLGVLAAGDEKSELGSFIYRSALNAERQRQQFFRENKYLEQPSTPPSAMTGTFNGKPFYSIEDADARIGARFEVLVAGSYMWIPFEHITRIEMQAPSKLRDLLWAPVIVQTSDKFSMRDLGEVLTPVLSPASFAHEDDEVRLGRSTDIVSDADGNEIPFGQRMLLIDGEEIPILELRKIELSAAIAAASAD